MTSSDPEIRTMRKSNLVLGLGLALSIVGSQVASAQQQSGAEGRRPQAGQQGERGRGQGGDRRRGPEGFLLRGITLTDAQKAQLQTLRTQDSAQFAARRQQGAKAGDELRAARERGDTATVRRLATERRTQMTQERDRRTSAIRNILTAEQRVAFDKNVAEAKERQAQRGERGEGRRGGKGGKGGERGGERRGR
jgi:Spy/CpxP family protein refolding chaperone